MATGQVAVQKLFHSYLNCDRPHESNVSLVGAPIAAVIKADSQMDVSGIPEAKPVVMSSSGTAGPGSACELSDASTARTVEADGATINAAIKKQRRREQNRRAAVKSRKRKKVYLQQLENKVEDLKARNAELFALVASLEQENRRLRTGGESRLADVASATCADLESVGSTTASPASRKAAGPAVAPLDEPLDAQRKKKQPRIGMDQRSVGAVTCKSAALVTQQRMTVLAFLHTFLSLLLSAFHMLATAGGHAATTSKARSLSTARPSSTASQTSLRPARRPAQISRTLTSGSSLLNSVPAGMARPPD